MIEAGCGCIRKFVYNYTPSTIPARQNIVSIRRLNPKDSRLRIANGTNAGHQKRAKNKNNALSSITTCLEFCIFNQSIPSIACWIAKMIGIVASGRNFLFFVFAIDATPVTPSSALAVKLAVAEKHILFRSFSVKVFIIRFSF